MPARPAATAPLTPAKRGFIDLTGDTGQNDTSGLCKAAEITRLLKKSNIEKQARNDVLQQAVNTSVANTDAIVKATSQNKPEIKHNNPKDTKKP